MNDEVNFWHADKHRSLLQVDSIILVVCNQACQKYPKQQFTLSLQNLKENIKDEGDFCASRYASEVSSD